MVSAQALQPIYALSDAIIFTGDAFVEGHAVLVQGSTILDIVANRSVPALAQRHSFAGQILSAGFMDLQVNGGGNILFNTAPTAESCIAIAAAHRAYGTTYILPTCITDQTDITQKAITATREARKLNSGIIGIHLEGPHISSEARGIHDQNNIRPITPQDEDLYHPQPDEIMLVTVAPENVSGAHIKMLCQYGCIVVLGHSHASKSQIREALQQGATGFTHLFNGMGGMSARAPGVSGIALDDRKSWCSLIVDGHHVSDEMIRLAIRAKPQGKIFFVSDAMPPSASTEEKPFELCGATIQVKNGCCVNDAGQLAGSVITMSDAVRYSVKTVGIELDEALRMATRYPAAFLGLDKKLGSLLPDYSADVIAFDPELTRSVPWAHAAKVSD